MIISLALLLGGTVLSAFAVPDLNPSYWTHELTTDAGLCVCPAGDGQPLTAMRNADGVVDGTIVLYVIDGTDTPIYLFPYEDLWLEAAGLNSCAGGSVADAPTDIEGRTTFSGALSCGGVQTGELTVMISGDTIDNPAPDADRYHLASPDLDGDGDVDLSDVVMLAERLESGVYDASVDYYFDGAITLSDVVTFAEHLQHACP